MRARPFFAMCAATLAAMATPAVAKGGDRGPVFLAGAASADITPPPWTAASDAAFVRACGPSADAVSTLWPGERRYQFEEPYVNGFGPDVHRFAPGDQYCDANHNGRYDAPYIAGGSGQNHWPTSTDTANPIRSEAVVFARGDTKIA